MWQGLGCILYNVSHHVGNLTLPMVLGSGCTNVSHHVANFDGLTSTVLGWGRG